MTPASVPFESLRQLAIRLAPAGTSYIVFLDGGYVTYYGHLHNRGHLHVLTTATDSEPSIHTGVDSIVRNEPWIHIEAMGIKNQRTLNFHLETL